MPPQIANAFLQSNQSAIRLFTKLQQGGVALKNGTTYTSADFVREWNGGGKKFLETHWRDAANTAAHAISAADRAEMRAAGLEDDAADDSAREMMQGKHEWIPTNFLGYVVEWAISKHNDIRWIYFADVLRIPTRLVVVHPSRCREPDAKDDPLGLQGHVGAIYLKGKGKGYTQRIKSQSTYHDELREILKGCLSITANDPELYGQALEQHIDHWYWTGDLTSAATACKLSATTFAAMPCPYYYNSGRSQYAAWGPTMGDMASKLTEGWAEWTRINQNQFAAGLTLSAR